MTCINVPGKEDSLYSVDLAIIFMFYFINAAKASFTKFCDHFKILQSIDHTYMSINNNITMCYPINKRAFKTYLNELNKIFLVDTRVLAYPETESSP